MKLYDKLKEDIRFVEGMNACINCGTCTAICAAACFYDYDPREVVDAVQSKNEQKIETLLKSETIWYCGECMSCKTRCPRNNAPGLIIMALRSLSQEMGYFVNSVKGRQQLLLKRTIGEWIINHGYCIIADGVTFTGHPEQGPMWEWFYKNKVDIFDKLGANYQKEGIGILRKIPEDTLDELKRIFEVSGGKERYDKIESYSKEYADNKNIDFSEKMDCDYVKYVAGEGK